MNILISEPATMITDYLLAVVSVVFGFSLLRLRTRRPEMSLLVWGIGFLVSALAALVGGTYHGFALYFSETLHRATWNVTMLLIGVSAGLFIAAILTTKRTPGDRGWLVWGTLLSVFGLLIQQSGLSILRNFNHNDLYHCIQAMAFFAFFNFARHRDYSPSR